MAVSSPTRGMDAWGTRRSTPQSVILGLSDITWRSDALANRRIGSSQLVEQACGERDLPGILNANSVSR